MFTPNRNLFHRDQVPEHFKELFIVSGYRSPGSSLKQCTLSVFKATNETLNFWTHFLPAIYYWYVTYYMSRELEFWSDSYTWPLMSYMIAVCVFPITSAIAHALNTLSDRARHICFFFDYAALSIFTMGASIAYKAYIFPDALINGTFHTLFLPVAVLNAILSLILCCQTRFMENGAMKKVMRVSAFAIPYVFDSAPMIYRIMYCASPEECNSPALIAHTYQFIPALVAAIMYISHVPERYFPATFDIVGHSHQIFHVFTIVAVHLQIQGLTQDLLDRRDFLLHHDVIPSAWTSILLMLTVILVDSLVLFWFVVKICHVTPEDPAWTNLYGDKEHHQVHGDSFIPCLRPSKLKLYAAQRFSNADLSSMDRPKSPQKSNADNSTNEMTNGKRHDGSGDAHVSNVDGVYRRKITKVVAENGNELLVGDRNEIGSRSPQNSSSSSQILKNGCIGGGDQ